MQLDKSSLSSIERTLNSEYENEKSILSETPKVMYIKSQYFSNVSLFASAMCMCIDADPYFNTLRNRFSTFASEPNCFIKNNPQILPEEIVENINELKKFMKSPYHTIMKNIHISDDKNIQIIIKDRYRLLNFKVEKEDLDEGNIDSLERNLKAMKMSLDLEKAGLDIEDIEIVCKMKDLLKKE